MLVPAVGGGTSNHGDRLRAEHVQRGKPERRCLIDDLTKQGMPMFRFSPLGGFTPCSRRNSTQRPRP